MKKLVTEYIPSPKPRFIPASTHIRPTHQPHFPIPSQDFQEQQSDTYTIPKGTGSSTNPKWEQLKSTILNSNNFEKVLNKIRHIKLGIELKNNKKKSDMKGKIIKRVRELPFSSMKRFINYNNIKNLKKMSNK